MTDQSLEITPTASLPVEKYPRFSLGKSGEKAWFEVSFFKSLCRRDCFIF